MQGLAHRVVAACLSKAGIVPGALMRIRDYDYEVGDYRQMMCVVTGIDWNQVAKPGYDNDQGSPRRLDSWFQGSIIKVRKPNGQEGYLRIPQNIKEQPHYSYYEKEPTNFGLLNGVVGGAVNKNSGWKGDNVTLLSPSAHGVYHWGVNKDDDSGERIVAGGELEEEINNLVSQVSKWVDY